MPSMTGTFELISSNNYEEYLLATGVERMLVDEVSDAPTIHITKKDDEWNITTCTDLEKTEIKFKLGKEFDETTDVFRFCKSVITQEGEDKLVHVQKYEDGQTLTILREFTDTQMKMTFEAVGKVTSYRIFQRQ